MGRILSLDELRDYNCWIGMCPLDVRRAVKHQGGWAKVFPDAVPPWANRVRNYFNETPEKFKKLNTTKALLAQLDMRLQDSPKDVTGAVALTDVVYRDQKGVLWFEMQTAGTVYHYPGEVTTMKKIGAALSPKEYIRVFKLISPDGTNGSREVCIHNWQLYRTPIRPMPRGKSSIRNALPWDNDGWVKLRNKVVNTEEFQGSYNYSETTIMGLKAHEKRDVRPHEQMTERYENPPMNTPIEARRFPKSDRRGRPLARPSSLFLGLATAR